MGSIRGECSGPPTMSQKSGSHFGGFILSMLSMEDHSFAAGAMSVQKQLPPAMTADRQGLGSPGALHQLPFRQRLPSRENPFRCRFP